MLTAPSSRAALEMLFDAAPEEAMRTIATAAVREPSLGSGWESTGPGIPALRGTVVLAAGEGSPAVQTVRLQRYATTPFAVTVTGVVVDAVSYTHLRAHETRHDLVCRLLLEKKQ